RRRPRLQRHADHRAGGLQPARLSLQLVRAGRAPLARRGRRHTHDARLARCRHAARACAAHGLNPGPSSSPGIPPVPLTGPARACRSFPLSLEILAMTVPRRLAPLALAAALAAAGAHAQEVYQIAYIDPLSGPFANVGELMRTHVQYAVEDVNAKGGVLKGTKLQLLQFDSKLSAQE